jgi:hypothetical protein
MATEPYTYWAIMEEEGGKRRVHSISEELDLGTSGLISTFKFMDDRAESTAKQMAEYRGLTLVAVARQTS